MDSCPRRAEAHKNNTHSRKQNANNHGNYHQDGSGSPYVDFCPKRERRYVWILHEKPLDTIAIEGEGGNYLTEQVV